MLERRSSNADWTGTLPCNKRISVCTKSGPVGLAFCALMICECFWGTNPKFFRTNHAYAIGVSGKGCREGRACTERGLLAPRNKAGSFATLVNRPGSDYFGFCRRPENNGAKIMAIFSRIVSLETLVQFLSGFHSRYCQLWMDNIVSKRSRYSI